MRVAALYDIHANLPALEAVVAEPAVMAADLVVVGGDVLAGPMPIETLALLDGSGRPSGVGARQHGARGRAGAAAWITASGSCGTGGPPGWRAS